MNLGKVPWHSYMPTDERHSQYQMPQTGAKCHKSKLYHEHMVRNLLLSHLSELPIIRAFKKAELAGEIKYKDFK